MAKRVLIIEDYADSAQILCLALESFGHVVRVAATGRDGIDVARAFRPDVIVCDLGLPDIDGLAVARTIRADVTLRHVRLVAFTAHSAPGPAAAAGFNAFIRKPADFREIAAQLEDTHAS